jgi:hypothetical protein
MFLSALVAVPFIALGAPSAKDRAIQWRSAAESLTVQTSSSINQPAGGTPMNFKGTYCQAPGLKLRYEIFHLGKSFGQVQNGTTIMSWEGEGKHYAAFHGISTLAGPSPEAAPPINFTFPSILLDRSMAELKDPAWKVSGDELSKSGESQMGKFTIKLTVGAKGEPLKLFISMEGEVSYASTTTFSGHSTKPIPDSTFSLRPFLGWTPLFTPEPSRPLEVGSQTLGRRFTDGLSGRAVDLKEGALGRGAVVAFVDPECPASAKLMGRLNILKEALKKKDFSLKVVSLGASRPAWSGPVIWDQSGQIEKAFGVSSTPTFFSLDKKGVILGAWVSFVPGDEAKIAGILAPPVEKKD